MFLLDVGRLWQDPIKSNKLLFILILKSAVEGRSNDNHVVPFLWWAFIWSDPENLDLVLAPLLLGSVI